MPTGGARSSFRRELAEIAAADLSADHRIGEAIAAATKASTLDLNAPDPPQELDKVWVYADAAGKTLYTNDAGSDAQDSACATGRDCSWRPALAMRDSEPIGAWTLLPVPDGRQWAYEGRPAYTSSADQVGTILQERPGNGWHAARARMTVADIGPAGLMAQQVDNANGLVLTDSRGMTLYVRTAEKAEHAPACPHGDCTYRWRPVLVSTLAVPDRDFTIVATSQGDVWAYKGKPLFSFEGDLAPGDAYGMALDDQMQPAYVLRDFMPSDIQSRYVAGKGVLLTNAAGMTVYFRDHYIPSFGGTAVRQAIPRSFASGRSLGTRGCTADCEKTWSPLFAPDRAQARGLWQVLLRDDGRKQWAYRGYALYTFSGDRVPGDTRGDETYELLDGTPTGPDAELMLEGYRAFDQRGAPALVWRAAWP